MHLWQQFSRGGMIFAIMFVCLLFLCAADGRAGDKPAPAATADQPAEAKEEKKDAKTGITLDDVEVRGTKAVGGMETTSTTVLGNEQIVDRIYVTPLDMLKLSPGVSISQYRQGGVVPAVQLRGFTTVGHSRHGIIALNGIALNTLDNADANVVIPMEVENVTITKGPSSPLYGNFNSAGAINFNTYQTGNFTRGKLSYGSYNTQNAVAVIARGDGKLDQVYAGEVYHTDGYQDHCDWDKQIAAGRWNYRFSDSLRAGLGVRFYNTDWDSAGYIPQILYDVNRAASVSDVNGGWRKWGLVDGHVDYALTDASKLKLVGWFSAEDWTRWYQNYVWPTQAAGSNYGTKYHRPRDAFGGNLAYHYKGQLLDRDANLLFGVSWQREHQLYEYWNLVVGQGRTPGGKTTDRDLTVWTTAVYGEFDYRIWGPLRVVLGGRYDMLEGSLDDNLDSANSDDHTGPEIFSPKVGLIFSMFEGWDLFANVSQGFALPGGADYISRSYLDPAIRTQYEAGLRANPNDWSRYSFSIWRLDTENDFQASLEDPNVYDNSGETRRQGIELSADVLPWKYLRLHLDYAYIDSEYLNYVSGGVNYEGNQISGVPNHIFNAEIAWDPPQGLGARLSYRLQGDWYIDSGNTIEADGFSVVNAQVSYKFNNRYRLALDVVNLLDEDYSEYYGTSNGQLTYAPADPLSAYLVLTIDW